MTTPGRKASDSVYSLATGDRLGPYEIVSPLGAGGMGEVYRARDPRLGREVAIKIVNRALAITPEHAERLAREARATSSLNHPNIVAVLDVGMEGPLPYVVSELLQGETLRDRLARGTLPYRKALDYGIQVAHALAAAHEKGIWHRDVKPANVFVTSDGRVKLLDFGLVKMSTAAPEAGPDDSTADLTQQGATLGTVGYMSPEQMLGEPVDQRTDLFALGAVLYEMLGGKPAFRRATAVETSRAVLSEDPPDLTTMNAAVTPAAVVVIRRCLEKNRSERFESARDLAFYLRQLQDTATPAAAGPRIGTRRRLILGGLSAAALAAAAAGGLLWSGRTRVPPAFEQITFRHARIGGARFTGTGGGVVYSEAREGRPLEVWWLAGPDGGASRLLGHVGADVLAVHAGKVALARGRRFLVGERFVGTLAEAPIGEGSPRDLAENIEEADWDPAGTQLAVVRSASASEVSRLEYPPGRLLYQTVGSIRHIRFSRDGRRLAFVEDATGRGAGGRVAVVDLSGQVRMLTDEWASVRGLGWSARGDEVWYAAGAWRTNRALRAVDLQGRQRLVLEAPASLTLWDVGADGQVLLARDEERSALVGIPPGETRERDLSWFDTSQLADLSEDGQQLLFADRFGVYIRRTDGTPPVHLGLQDGFGDDFSPDGTKVLATTESGHQLVIVSAGLGGEPRVLPTHGIAAYRGAMWFPDGRRILFNGTRPGASLRSYVQGLEGGMPEALTPENVWATTISPDGKWVAAIGSDQGISLWPVDGGEPVRVQGTVPGERPVAWTSDGRALWVFRRGEVPAEVHQIDIASGRRQPWRNLTPPDASGVYSITNFNVTRDGRSYFYSYKRILSQLFTAQGLR